jgi:Tol biopolymer transport system component
MTAVTRRNFVKGTLTVGAGGLLAGHASGAAARAAAGPGGSVTYTEGTNMSVAVSPAADRLVIEVQGILWRLSAAGGEGTQLTRWDLEPASPDWSKTGLLTFQAYRGGNFHVWTMAPDGSGLRRWTDGPFDDREPAWSPDGTKIAFCSDRAIGTSLQTGVYDIWVLDVRTGQLQRLTAGTTEDYMPTWSADGASVVFVRDATAIASVPASGGTVSTLTTVTTGSVVYPAVSRSGTLAYVHLGPATGIPFGGPETTSDLVVGGTAVTSGEDVAPVPLRWLPDGRILYVGDGAIRVRKPGAGAAREIPFHVRLGHTPPRYRKKRFDFDSTAAKPVRGIATPRLSPDGRQVAFIALNALWLMPAGGRPRRLLASPPQFLLQSLAWARDGGSLVFSWDRDGLPAIYRYTLGNGVVSRLTTMAGAQYQSALSPDGSRLAFMTEIHDLYVQDLASGAATKLASPLRGPERVGPPSWSPDGKWIAFNDRQQINGRFREGYNVIRVVDAASGSYTLHAPAPFRSISDRADCGPAWSPDGKWMAFIMESALWVIPVDAAGAPTGPAQMLTGEPADSPSWSGDSRTLLYLSNGVLRRIDLGTRRPVTVPLALTWRADIRPRSEVTRIYAGRLWDGTSDRVRTGVDVIVAGNRIKAITAHREGSTSGEQYLDAHDKTVIPGLWECHNHPTFEQPGEGGRYLSLYLAYGVTSNVSMGSYAYLSTADREGLRTGRRRGPRLFGSIGELFEGSRVSHPPVRAHATDAGFRRSLERAQALDYDFVKTYVRAPGTVMAQAARFGHEVLGVPSGSHLIDPGFQAGQDMTAHLQATQRLPFGHAVTATGHTYQDVYTTYTQGGFTLMITPFSAQILFGADPAIAADPRIRQLMAPWDAAVVDAESKQPPSQTRLNAMLTEVRIYATVLHRGGVVITGTDSPLVPPAVSLHIALRSLIKGGMTPPEALHTATLLPARTWGVDGDLGTLQPGKLADLAVIAGNPFAHFDDLINVTHVMTDGRLLDVAQIIGAYPKPSAARTAADWRATAATLRGGGCCSHLLPALNLA